MFFSALVWLAFSWPLPKHVSEGVPASSRSPGPENVQYMAPGDHLQLMYHFWLLEDMLKGKTTAFHNLYEFNTGNDSDRFAPSPYYLPFSAFFALADMFASRSLAWNLTGFISIWLSLLFTWLLAMRYSPGSPKTALLAAIIANLLPVRWINLFGGSPAGFAMLCVPGMLLGLDMAIREHSTKGGILAGACLTFAGFCDLHVFFFSALIAPAWCAIALIKRGRFAWLQLSSYKRLAAALFPAVLLGGLTTAYRIGKQAGMEETTMSSGRTLSEVALFSPQPTGLLSFANTGISNHVFLGWGLLATIAIGIAATLFLAVKERRAQMWLHTLAILMICAGMILITFLALGPNGPMEGRFLRAARKLIPHYEMIRQPAKIYSLAPALTGVLLAASFGALICLAKLHRRKTVTGIVLLLSLWIAVECKIHAQPLISLTASEQGAYAAVHSDATQKNTRPRALIVPLWPGDSAWSSLYEHYASLYRIRMLNGYSPVVPVSYVDNVFRKLESVNKGVIAPDQFDLLDKMKIDYLLLHENAFPEKVSPLPVGFTLRNFLENPRLELINNTGPVWAFRIADNPKESNVTRTGWNSFFPARRWEFEWNPPENSAVTNDPSASKELYLSLSKTNVTARTKPLHMAPAPDLRWLLRIRGQAEIRIEKMFGDRAAEVLHTTLAAPEWQWTSIPAKSLNSYQQVHLRITLLSGKADLDLAMLTAGKWKGLDNPEELQIPAPLFFHAGYTEMEERSVVFHPRRVPGGFKGFEKNGCRDIRGDRGILYGPRLPLSRGTYSVTVVYDTLAPPETRLGGFYVRSGKPALACSEIIAGEPATCDFKQKHELPVSVNFLYAGKNDMRIKTIVFTRLKNMPESWAIDE